MPNTSFVQGNFLGGRWSPNAQGRMHDQNWKFALNECLNGYPLEAGCWTARQGFRKLGTTRQGQAGVLRAFDFTITQPYQIEFTPLRARLWAGLGLVQEADGTLNVNSIDTASNIYLVQPIPAAWAAGDTVMVSINSLPCSTMKLCNRQLEIVSINTTNNSINVIDSVTRAALGNIGFVYSSAVDTIFKVFEVVTPYVAGDLAGLRTVQDSTTVIVLSAAHKPKILQASANPQPFALSDVTFLDGPYLTQNLTTTTLTLSNITGDVTVTASSTVGINGGNGFQPTDVGRHLRFQSAWPQWNSGTTYVQNQKVTGSDNNIYRSIVGGNLNHDPTLDDGTHWRITASLATWSWLKIKTFTDTTHVVATVMDSTQVSDPNCLSASPYVYAGGTATAATTNWALGAFSDTTGWPTCGCYHEGRLWLAGNSGNWIYASFSNDHFVFTPTAADGTVGDANGMSEQLNANDVNNPFWLLSTDQGVLMTTQAAEWLIYSSVGENDITPTTIAAKRVSEYGGMNAEPVKASVVGFIQRNKTRLLAHAPLIQGKFFADNLSELADDLCAPGLAEVRWQQSPNLTIWGRRNDGILLGTTFQKVPMYSAYPARNGAFTAWHQHRHGQGRIFESISSGPSYNGLSDTLYAITNNTATSQTDTNVRNVESLSPLFDSSQPDWAAYFTDGGGTPCCAVQRAIANGDSFDGVQLYGFLSNVGETVQPTLGALDLGDRVVAADGSVSVPYLSDPDGVFTAAFWQAFSNGTNYYPFVTQITYTTQVALPATPIGADTINAYADTSADPGYTNDIALLDGVNDKIYLAAEGSVYDSPAGRLRRFTGTTGADDLSVSIDTLYSGLGIAAWNSGTNYVAGNRVVASDGHYYISSDSNTNQNPAGGANVHWINAKIVATYARALGAGDGNLYLSIEGGNTTPIMKVNATTLVGSAIFGTTSSNTGPSGNSNGGIIASGCFVHDGTNLWSCGLSGNEVSALSTAGMTFVGYTNMDETIGHLCTGGGLTYGVGRPSLSSPSTGSIGIYRFDAGTGAVYKYKAGTIAPSALDATWTHWAALSGPAFDARDGNLILMAGTTDSVTNTCYVFKVNPNTAAILWKVAIPGFTSGLPVNDEAMNHTKILNYRWCFVAGSSNTVYEIHTDAGTLVTYAWNTGLAPTGGQQYDDISASVTFFGGFTSGQSGPTVTEIGVYLTAHPGSFATKWGRIYLGGTTLGRTAPSTVTYSVPASLGFVYDKEGQLLRPDFGQDAGAAAGPGFGKTRRLHRYSANLYRSQKVKIGTDFTTMHAIPLTSAGERPIVCPAFASGVFTAPLENTYSFDGQIAWKASRPYPLTVVAMGGFIETQDR